MNALPTDDQMKDLMAGKNSNLSVFLTINDVRIVTYLIDDIRIWEIQRRGIIFFWRWHRVQRWAKVGDKYIVIPNDRHQSLP